MITHNTKGRFRGKRNYYHSTDLYLELAYLIYSYFRNSSCKNLKINFRKLSVANPVFSVQEHPFEDKNLIADATFEIDNTRWFCNITEDVTKIDEIVDYNESMIVNGSKNEQFKRLFVDVGLKFHPIEIVTALSMDLLKEYRLPDDGEKWVLSQLHAPHLLCETKKNIEVTLKSGGGGIYSNLYASIDNEWLTRLIFCKIKT